MKHQAMIRIFYFIFCLLGTNNSNAEQNYSPYSKNCQFKVISTIDDLLYQMYQHLDDNCLINTPVSALEKALGIRIIDDSLNPYKNGYVEKKRLAKLTETATLTDDFIDNLIVIKQRDAIISDELFYAITMTERYFKRNGSTLFAGNIFPKNLPKPRYSLSCQINEPPNQTNLVNKAPLGDLIKKNNRLIYSWWKNGKNFISFSANNLNQVKVVTVRLVL